MTVPDSDPSSPRGWRRYRLLIYFVLGVALLDVLVASQRHVWETYSPDDYAERLRGCRAARPDLLLAGGSPVTEGLDPAVLAGLTRHGRKLEKAYNLGLPGGTTSEVYHAVRHGARTPPALLVYGITASDLNDARQEPHGAHSLMTWNDVWSWARCRPESGVWIVRQSLKARLGQAWQLYRHRDGIRLWAAALAERLLPGSFPEPAREAALNRDYARRLRDNAGFAPLPSQVDRRLDQMKATGFAPTEFPFLCNYRLGSHLKYLHRLLDWADGHGVEAVLVDMPVSADLEERLHSREFAAYRSALAEVAKSRGVRVVHADRRTLGLEDRHFADLIHLNAEGAGRLSAWLRRELER